MPEPQEGAKPEETSLGEPIRVFRAGMLTRVLIGFCGLVVILVGVALIFAGTGQIGAYPVALGLMIVALAVLIPKQQYLVCPGGIVVIRSGKKQLFRWEDIAEIIDQRVTHGMVSGRVCVLVRKTGSKISFSDTGISDFGAMIALLREQAKAHSIPWKEEHLKT
jgi:hypothetical protein